VSVQHATSAIPAAPADVRRLLVDPLALPSWNPAFHSIDGTTRPAAGTPYAIRVRPGLTGWLEYTRIGRDRIDMAWHVPGSTRRVHGRSSRPAGERSCITGSSTPARWRRLCVTRTGESLHSVCSALPARSTRPGSRRRSPEPVQIGVCPFRGLDLPGCLCNSPSSGPSVNREDRPPAAVLVAEVDEQRLVVVLDPQSVSRVARLVENPRRLGERVGHERRPPSSSPGAATGGQRHVGHRGSPLRHR